MHARVSCTLQTKTKLGHVLITGTIKDICHVLKRLTEKAWLRGALKALNLLTAPNQGWRCGVLRKKSM